MTLVALGGARRLWLGFENKKAWDYKDYIPVFDKELHEVLGMPVGTLINTGRASADPVTITVSKPAGDITLYGNGTQSMVLNSSNKLRFSIEGSNSNLSDIGIGTVIRAAGVGYADSWEILLAINKAQKEQIGDKYDYENVNKSNEAITVVWTLTTQDQVDAIKANSLVIEGTNFVLKYVTLENPSATNPDATTIDLVTSTNAITAMNSSATPIVTDASTGRSYANRIVGGTTRLVGKATINADEKTYGYWNFKIGPGNSGDGILPERSNNLSEYSGWKQNDVVNIDLLLTEELKNKIVNAVGKEGEYWPGGMITFQGHNVTLTELKLTNCLPEE